MSLPHPCYCICSLLARLQNRFKRYSSVSRCYLAVLDVYYCSLTLVTLPDTQGPIPTELGQLSDLDEFWAHSSMLSGTIPSELGQTALRHLRLQKTRINGTIPEELYNLSLERLDLWETFVTGTISSRIGQLAPTLSMLRLQNNSLTGMIPSEMGLLTNLGTLYLELNHLKGQIPTRLCDKVLGRTNNNNNRTIYDGNLTNGVTMSANQTLDDNVTTMELEIAADCLVSNQTGWPRVSCEFGCCAVCCDSVNGTCQS